MWGLKINKIKNTNNNVDLYQVSISRAEKHDYTLFFSSESSVIDFVRYMEDKQGRDIERIIINYNRKNKLLKIEQRR